MKKFHYTVLSFIVSFTLFLSCNVSEEKTSDIIVLKGATLFDGTGSEPVANSIVVINGKRIDCIGTEFQCDIPTNAEMIDVNGKFITPGMIDAHVHFFLTGFFDSRPDAMDITDTYPYPEVAAYQRKHPQRYFNTYLCSGITGVYDVGGFSWSIDLQEEAEQNPNAPHVAAAGPLITPFQGAPFDLPSDKALVTLNSAETGINTVQHLSALGSTGIKFWTLSLEENYLKYLKATAQEIQRQENQMIAHATTLDQAKAALRYGAKLLVHSVEDTVVDQEFIELAKNNATIYTPTLILKSGYSLAYRAAAGNKPLETNDPYGCVDEKTAKLIGSASQFSNHPMF
ncbi:MAG: hypothetical protein R3220_07555, partial [Balneolaceae bacterium]|nr:hypothetical protein [Balneolaceae bacterium]